METIPVPLAVKLLIASHNERMEHSLKNITDANVKFVTIGWMEIGFG